MCQPRKVQAFIQDPVVVQLFIHHECLEKLKQRYDRSQKLHFTIQSEPEYFEELVLRTSRKTSFENNVTCEDLQPLNH